MICVVSEIRRLKPEPQRGESDHSERKARYGGLKGSGGAQSEYSLDLDTFDSSSEVVQKVRLAIICRNADVQAWFTNG